MTCITQIRITMVPVDSQSCKYVRSYPISYHSDVVFWVSVWFYSQLHYVKSTFILLAKSFLSLFIRFSKVDLTRILRLTLYMCLWSWQLAVRKLCHSSVRLSLSSPRGGRSSITRGICGGKERHSVGGFYLKYFGFPLSLSFNQSTTLIHLSVTEDADLSKLQQLCIFSKYNT